MCLRYQQQNKMKEYFSTYSKEHVFVLDEDGDNYMSFDKAIEAIKKMTRPSEQNFKHDFLDGGVGFFIKEGVRMKIACSNWDGTELRVYKDELSEVDLSKVRQWDKEIYKDIHNKET